MFRCEKVSMRWAANIDFYSPWWLKSRKMRTEFKIITVSIDNKFAIICSSFRTASLRTIRLCGSTMTASPSMAT